MVLHGNLQQDVLGVCDAMDTLYQRPLLSQFKAVVFRYKNAVMVKYKI